MTPSFSRPFCAWLQQRSELHLPCSCPSASDAPSDTLNRARKRLEPMLHRAAHRPGCIRFPFEAAAGTGPAKPPGIGMVCAPEHDAASAPTPATAPSLHDALRIGSAARPRRSWSRRALFSPFGTPQRSLFRLSGRSARRVTTPANLAGHGERCRTPSLRQLHRRNFAQARIPHAPQGHSL
jgi:hypothetical protein